MRPVLKYPGSKWKLAQWIISNFPPNYKKMTYLEPYFGSGAVFFNKPRSSVETINDIDGNVINLFKVIRDNPEELARLIRFTPWSRLEYKQSYDLTDDLTDDLIENARRFLVRSWMAIGSKTSDITGWRNNIKGINGNLTQWNYGLPEEIINVSNRLLTDGKGIVQIETKPAINVIIRHRKRNVIIYVDPPYPLQTRSNRIYANEMTDNNHIELLETLNDHPGPVILSGYACELYDSRLKHWRRITHPARAEGGRPREEVLWINPIAAQYNQTLFG